MRKFSQLLDALVYTRSPNAKLIGGYLRRTSAPPPRGCRCSPPSSSASPPNSATAPNSTAGIMAACVPAALLGEKLQAAVPIRATRYSVAALFLIVGLIAAVKALQLA